MPTLLRLEASLPPPPSPLLPPADADGPSPPPQQHLFFHKTYMPPRFLLAGRAARGGDGVVTDLGGADLHADALAPPPWAAQAQATGQPVLLITPASVSLEPLLPRKGDGGSSSSSCEVVASVFPHLSTEDPPSSLAAMALRVWRVDPPKAPLPLGQERKGGE